MNLSKFLSTTMIFFIFLVFPLNGGVGTQQATTPEASLEKDLQLAQNYYMLMLDEGIGTSAEKKAEKYLRDAGKILHSSLLPEGKKKSYQRQLDTLSKELRDYLSVKRNTLDGFFPFLKYTASSFFFSPEDAEVHTLMKNPDYVAVKRAAHSLASSLKGPGEIVFNSRPPNSALEKIIFSIFNSSGSLSAHLDRDIVAALKDPELIERFKEDNITKPVYSKLIAAFSGNPLYVATITRELSDPKDRLYAINAAYFDQKGYSSKKSVSSSGYAIDERSNWLLILTIHLLLLLIALGFVYRMENSATSRTYAATLLFFLFGRVFPILVVPTVMSFKPDGDIHVLYGLWWIIVAGIAILVLPVYAIKMFYGKVVDYLPLPNIEGKGREVGVAVASGILAFLSVPYVFGFGSTLTLVNLLSFATFSFAILLSGYVTGKVLDDNDKLEEKYIVVFAITSALLMAAFLHGDSFYLVLSSLFTIAAGLIVLYLHNRTMKQQIQNMEELPVEVSKSDGALCENIQSKDLIELVQNPPYQKFDYFHTALESASSLMDGKTGYCVLKGNAGAGKTATAKMLIHSVALQQEEKGAPVLFLSGTCEKRDGQEVPYESFYELLDSTLDMDLFGRREKDEKIDNAIKLASRFMMGPVASFLASGDGGTQNAFSKNDIFIFVKRKLLELSRNNPLILFIDDLQWIDSASRELLAYLMKEFPSGSDHPILFLFTARDTVEGNAKIKELELEANAISIGLIDKTEQRELLENSFCLAPSSSRWITEWAAEQNDNRIYPYILVDAVGNLARNGQFEIDETRFTLKKDFDFDHPPHSGRPQEGGRTILHGTSRIQRSAQSGRYVRQRVQR